MSGLKHTCKTVSLALVFTIGTLGSSSIAGTLKQGAEKYLQATFSNVKCEEKDRGNRVTCTADKAALSNADIQRRMGEYIEIRNYKADFVISGKDKMTYTGSMDLKYTDKFIREISRDAGALDVMDAVPNKVMCKGEYVLKNSLVNANYNCDISAKLYKLGLLGNMDVESSEYKNASIQEAALDSGIEALMEILDDDNPDSNKLSNYKVRFNTAEIRLDNNGLDKLIFDMVKAKKGENMSRSEYNSMIDLGVAYVPVALAQKDNLSKGVANNLSNITSILGDMAKGNKKGITVTAKDKKAKLFPLENLSSNIKDSDDDDIIDYLNRLDITVRSR